MNHLQFLGAADCAGLQPRMFAANHAEGEKLAPGIQALLEPARMNSMRCWMLPKELATELHFHDYDEYWAWVKGRTLLTIRLPDGRSDRFEIGRGWIVYCVRGVEHGHRPLEDWGCFEWTGVLRPDARQGHLIRDL